MNFTFDHKRDATCKFINRLGVSNSMSLEEVQKLDNPYDRLGYVLEQAPDENQDYKYLAQDKDGKVQYCSLGWVGKYIGIDNEKLLPKSRIKQSLNLFGIGSVDATTIFNEFGFTKEQKKIKHECPEPKCSETHTLEILIIHMNDVHHYPRKYIGRIVKKYKNSGKAPELSIGDNFYKLFIDFKTLFKL